MAHKLGFKVIAEGVETKEQSDLLAAAGCDYAQGNLYSEPVLPDEFEVMFQHGLNTRPQTEGLAPSELAEHSILTEQEAIAFLQPHMPNKSVNVWLAHDRHHDPIIPFFLVQGQPCYLESDLAIFVTRTLNTSARFVRLNNRLYLDRRKSFDRRKHDGRRPAAGGISRQGIKRRRRGDMGSRLQAELDRRANVDPDRHARPSQTLH
jgi:hypothetical protein